MYSLVATPGKPNTAPQGYVDTMMAETVGNPLPAADTKQIAQALFDAGRPVKVNGVVGHSSGLNTASMTLALGAIFTLIGILWPLLGLVGLVAIVGSAIVDMEGGRGWIRSLLTADATHNLIVWTEDCIPGNIHATPKETLLITSPIAPQVCIARRGNGWPVFHLACLLVSAVSVAACIWLGPYPPTVCSVVLAISSTGLQVLNWMSKRALVENPARRVWLRAMERCPQTTDLRVVWALVGGAGGHHDGLATLLLNHQVFLPPDRTRVLAIHPGIGTCSWVSKEGRVQSVDADPVIGKVLGDSGIPDGQITTAARTALRLGWPAAALSVSADQVHLGTSVVCSAIENAEKLSLAGKW